MRAAQVHTCNEDYCLKLMRDGTRKCKRRAPFPLADADWVDEEGNWGPQRTYGYLNNWCPPLVGLLRANHDIKLITNGSETKSEFFGTARARSVSPRTERCISRRPARTQPAALVQVLECAEPPERALRAAGRHVPYGLGGLSEEFPELVGQYALTQQAL